MEASPTQGSRGRRSEGGASAGRAADAVNIQTHNPPDLAALRVRGREWEAQWDGARKRAAYYNRDV